MRRPSAPTPPVTAGGELACASPVLPRVQASIVEGPTPLLSIGQLKKFHLTACLQGQKTLNSTTLNGLCRAVLRAFR